ncbi:MAG: hypothetical protein J6M53_05305 [Bacteroidaceae bacterium]|nr:hypothetical protein [Bacteroidaceae bacterium]
MDYFNIPHLAFPSEIDECSFPINYNVALTTVVLVDGTEVLRTKLYPVDGRVTLYDLAALLRDNLSIEKVSDVQLRVGSTTKDISILPSRCAMDEAEDFTTHHFLSLLDGVKPTYLEATEFLPLYFDGSYDDLQEASPSLVSTWVNPVTGDIKTQAENFSSATSHDDFLWQLVFQPKRFVAPADGYTLHSIRACLEDRVQEYVVQTPIDSTPFSLKFYNNFGLLETFHFFGTCEKELKPTRSTASFNGKTRNYKVEAVPTWKCDTGALLPSVQPLFADLCAATQVWRQDTGTEVTITDNEYKISDDRYALQTASLTFRETARTAAHVKTSAPKRTFDSSFDETFF